MLLVHMISGSEVQKKMVSIAISLFFSYSGISPTQDAKL